MHYGPENEKIIIIACIPKRSLQPFSQAYDIVSLTTYAVSINLYTYMNGGTYSFKSTPNNRFLRNFSWQFLFALRVFARNLLRESRCRNTFLHIIKS